MHLGVGARALRRPNHVRYVQQLIIGGTEGGHLGNTNANSKNTRLRLAQPRIYIALLISVKKGSIYSGMLTVKKLYCLQM